MLPAHRPLAEDFTGAPRTFLGATHTVWRSGEGPGVVIMHEIPGITPAVSRFARIVRDRGFSVFLPELFGTNDKPPSGPYLARQMVRACVSREFRVLAAGQSSPIVDWLRALCDEAHAELGGPGVGALGMCLTGNFGLALAVRPSVRAPVLSQPSLPFPLGAERRRGLHVSAADLGTVEKRVRDEGLQVLGLRFTHDPVCRKARFDHLQDALGDGFVRVDIDSSRGNPNGIPTIAHSVLTEELVDDEGHPTMQAVERVLSFFDTHLR